MSEIQNRLQSLRLEVKRMGGDAFYCALSDAHLSEYIQRADQFLTYLTGFTGSNAKLLITESRALLWTDSRYWEQAGQELSGTGIELMKEGLKEVPAVDEWLAANKGETFTLVTPLETMPLERYRKFEKSVTRIVDFTDETIARVWPERPKREIHSLYVHKASSVSATDKLKRLQSYVADQKVTGSEKALLLTKLDDIAWLTNLRGSDIDFNPVFLSWALVGEDCATLFVNVTAIDETIKNHLTEAGWRIADYSSFETFLADFIARGGQCLGRTQQLNAKLFQLVGNAWSESAHPVALWKSVKTPEELEGLRAVMKADGHALEEFIKELKARLLRGEKLTENDAAAILHEKRAAIDGFIGESFGTIAAVDANAALPHYEPKTGEGTPITPPCLLLVDSGAHYDKGTTDTTRVWFLGDTKDVPAEKLLRMKRDYTAVYKAMKALSEATFKPGTRGVDLDKIARAPIHAIGADFGHGTGHGIGLTLNVHETPPTISPREHEGSVTPFEPGMVTSDEPGIYRPGEWGIRLENMLVCVQKADGLLGFETLTQCEIDKTLLE